jgi:hypothetical protein
LLDASIAGVSNVNPAAITFGAATVASSGSTAAAAVQDLRVLVSTFVMAGGSPERATLLLSSENAIALALSGHEAFRGLRRDGGVVGGMPALAADAVGSQLVLVDSDQLVVADEGEVDFSLSRQAAVEMLDSALQQDGTAGTGASLVSLWQNNLIGLRAERTINWSATAVAVVENAIYGASGSPLS